MKDKIVLTLVYGILILLTLVILVDLRYSIVESQPLNEGITHLLQVTITGLIGILGTYFGMRNKDK
jgi:hypothetical protein